MRRMFLAAAIGLLCASACSSLPKPDLDAAPAPAPVSEPDSIAPVIPAAAEPTPRARVNLAAELLGAGKAGEARRELDLALAKTPRDATALHLLEQIEADPVKLLGPAHETYVVQAGDSMSVLAARFLGDPLMFYALSRYNGLAAPNALTVGRTLKIPRTKKATSVAHSPAEPAPLSQVRPVDAQKANAVRLRALESLNTGDVTQAVALLKEAQTLDSTDPAIQRDLDRALRIEASLVDG
jgi:hypothetical protein